MRFNFNSSLLLYFKYYIEVQNIDSRMQTNEAPPKN